MVPLQGMSSGLLAREHAARCGVLSRARRPRLRALPASLHRLVLATQERRNIP